MIISWGEYAGHKAISIALVFLTFKIKNYEKSNVYG